MRIDQRNNGSSITMSSGGNVYPVDRFSCEQGGISANTATIQRVSDAPSGFTYSIKYTAGSITFNNSSGWSGIHQRIEGYNVSDLKWGTSSALPVTLSFWVKSSLTGTFSINMTHYDGSVERWNNNSYTINLSNTWEYKTLTFIGDSSYGITNDNGTNGWMRVYWSIGDNSGNASTTTTKNTWFNGAAANRAVSGQINLISTSGATFFLTGVQLEVGKVATPFEYRSYGQELALCQRYYEKCFLYGLMTAYVSGGYNYHNGSYTFQVEKRVVPSQGVSNASVTNYQPGGGTGTASISNSTTTGFKYISGSTNQTFTDQWINDSSTYLGADAEL